MSDSIRQRAGKGTAAPAVAVKKAGAKSSSSGWNVLDIARSIVFLFLCSGLLSWFVTGKDFYWGYRPSYTKIDYWKGLLSGANGPLQLTDDQLKAYDGSDPETPIYLALNGTIYDVTAGRRFYGPGGAYDFFSGRDATRAFITSCFDTDSQFTHDVRDVETMHLPTTTPEIDAQWTSGQLKALREQEMRNAKKKVKESLDHWVGFFSTSEKYKTVGTVKRAPGWEKAFKGPPPEFCAKAKEGRPVRPAPPPGMGKAKA